MVHRDIKLSNCLLDSRGHLKLCDFGSAKILFDLDDCHGPYSPRKSYDVCPRTRTFIGTSPFMAPEVRKLQYGVTNGNSSDSSSSSNKADICTEIDGYSLPVDWYALGIVFFELLTGSHEACLSYGDVNNLLSDSNGYNRSLYDNLEVSDFIIRLLNEDPRRRLGYWHRDEILCHPAFVKGRTDKDKIDWSALEMGTSEAPTVEFDKSVGHFELIQLLLLSDNESSSNFYDYDDRMLSTDEQSKFEGY